MIDTGIIGDVAGCMALTGAIVLNVIIQIQIFTIKRVAVHYSIWIPNI